MNKNPNIPQNNMLRKSVNLKGGPLGPMRKY